MTAFKPLTGTDAIRATLEAKIRISAIRAEHGPTKAYRTREAAILADAQRKLASIA
jgi:predicted DNA-binding protein